MRELAHESPKQLQKRLTSGFTQMIEARHCSGWSSSLVTILFDNICGPQPNSLLYMRREIERVYSTLVTRVHRRPASASNDQLPLMIGAFDLPIYKRDRTSIPRVSVNDGLHFHCVLMVPPASRLRQTAAEHFSSNSRLYSGGARGIARIDVRPITHTTDEVVGYVFKTVGSGRISYDDAVVVLPRTRSELSLH